MGGGVGGGNVKPDKKDDGEKQGDFSIPSGVADLSEGELKRVARVLLFFGGATIGGQVRLQEAIWQLLQEADKHAPEAVSSEEPPDRDLKK